MHNFRFQILSNIFTKFYFLFWGERLEATFENAWLKEKQNKKEQGYPRSQ